MDEKQALLEQLRDVEIPVVSGVPAVGWWLLFALATLVVLVFLLFRRRRRQLLWKTQSKQEMQDIRDALGNQTSVELLSRCSALARKIVLAVDRREEVAALHGEDWLEKLDDVCARPEFSQGIGRLLLDRQYQKQSSVAKHDMEALFESMDVLIDSAQRNKPRRDSASRTDAVNAEPASRSNNV